MPLSPAQKTAIVDRRKKVAEMLLERWLLTDIARELGNSRTTISHDAREIRKQWREDHSETYDAIVERECSVLDADERALREELKKAKGLSDRLAIRDRIVKVMERRAKLLGADAPEKKAIMGPDGGAIALVHAGVNVDDEQTAELASRLLAQFDAAEEDDADDGGGDGAGGPGEAGTGEPLQEP